jgi:ABC-type protease/lipase transport system fused ATPase/permease subunit
MKKFNFDFNFSKGLDLLKNFTTFGVTSVLYFLIWEYIKLYIIYTLAPDLNFRAVTIVILLLMVLNMVLFKMSVQLIQYVIRNKKTPQKYLKNEGIVEDSRRVGEE